MSENKIHYTHATDPRPASIEIGKPLSLHHRGNDIRNILKLDCNGIETYHDIEAPSLAGLYTNFPRILQY